MDNFSLIVRPFHLADRPQLRKINYETSFLESPHDFIDDDELVADALTVYFTDYEPESCFVAVQENKVIGYLTGAKNAAIMNRIALSKIYPSVLMKSLGSPSLWHSKSWKFVWGCFKSLVKGELIRPDFSKNYPAVFHINIEKGFRARGVGRKLMETYLKYLQGNKIAGVHCGTLSKEAKEFFEKLGFKVLLECPRFYNPPSVREKGSCYILGKTL